MQITGSLWLDDALINNHHLVLSDAQFPILPPGSFQIILLSAFQTSPHWVTVTLLSLWHLRHSSSILGWRMHSLSQSPCTFPALDIFQFHHLTRSWLQCQQRQFSRALLSLEFLCCHSWQVLLASLCHLALSFSHTLISGGMEFEKKCGTLFFFRVGNREPENTGTVWFWFHY